MYLNPYATPALIACFISMFIGIYVFSKNPRNMQNRVFTLIALWLIIFCVGEAMLRFSSSSEEGRLWGQIGYSGAIFAPLFFYHLSFIFPRKRMIFKKQRNRDILLIISYLAGFSVFLLFNLIVSVQDVQFSEFGYRLDLTLSTSFVGVWVIILLIASVVNLLRNYQNSESSIEKKQIIYVFYGALAGITITIPTGILLPIIGIKIFPMSVIAIPIFCLFVGAAILKHSLFIYRPMTETIIEQEKMSLLNRDELEKEVKIRTAALLKSNEMLKIQIIERKNVEEKIKKQNIELERLSRVKSEFLNITSHELRTPMTSMKGYIQMLLNQKLGKLKEEQQKALAVVLRNTNRLDRLVQDIIDTSQLESGTMKFIPKKTDIKQLMKDTVETLQPDADEKGITIAVDVESFLPKLVIDQDRIEQVCNNLVNNAIKFSPDGSVINLRAEKQEENVLIEIQDYGKGIPRKKQQKVFEPFYQVESGMDRLFGGTGLGLSISRSIVIAHGGKIWLEGKEGKGSTFRFTLPIKSVQNVEGTFEKIDMSVMEKTKENSMRE